MKCHHFVPTHNVSNAMDFENQMLFQKERRTFPEMLQHFSVRSFLLRSLKMCQKLEKKILFAKRNKLLKKTKKKKLKNTPRVKARNKLNLSASRLLILS